MTRLLSLLLCVFTLTSLKAQIYNPVKWETTYKAVSANEFDLIFTAKIEDGWTVYSQFLENDEGPVATTFNFEEDKHFSKVGKTKESELNKKAGFDKIFEMNVVKYAKKAVFTQRVKATDLAKPITGYVNYMTCDATKCLPPTDFDFEFKLEAPAATQTKPATKPVEKAKENLKDAHKQQPIPQSNSKTSSSKNKTSSGTQTQVKKSTEKAKTKLAEASDKAKNILSNKKEISTETEGFAIDQTIDLSTAANDNQSDILDPVDWTISSKKISDTEYDFIFKAKIDKGWSIYSQFLEGEDGPVPTSFIYDEGSHYERVGKTKENGPKRIAGFDKIFEMNVVKFKETADFTQRIKIKDAKKSVSGFLEFMTCDDTRCLPPGEVDFHFDPATGITLIGDEARKKIEGGTGTGAIPSAPKVEGNAGPYPAVVSNVDLENPVSKCSVATLSVEENSSIWNILVLGFLGGLVALLTPCVFPMIPLTVSFFTKGSENKSKGLFNAALYGFFIFGVYLLLSVPFHLLDSVNPGILNDISTNVWLNIAFFVIFLFFAFSFFGYYELTLPASWSNKASSAEGAGGIIGIFFMALTLALVSFSCTGPILGSLLAGALSSDGGAWQLTAGMGGFGLALALPFALFAAFPSWMNTLPRSGGWLTTVKVVLGFLELALAFKFLSNADLVTRWGLLKIEPFLIIWIVIFLGLAFYLFGKIKFPHDSPIKKLSPVRMGLGILSFAFAVYLMSGFRYDERAQTFSSLTLLSGLAPPAGYSWMHPKKCPNNLDCFKDFQLGLEHAQQNGKPILVDFTGHACVNCRKMEEHVWPENEIYKYLKDDYVLISLYVDEKIELPKDQQVKVEDVTGSQRKLRTKGHKWQHFQTKYFNNNSQPFYVLLSPEGELLNKPVGYTPDVNEYANFLECGLKAFDEVKGRKEILGAR